MIVTSQLIEDGIRTITMQFTGRGEAGEQETNVVKVDVSTLIPQCRGVKVREIQYDVAYGVVVLAWDGPVPVEFANLDGYGMFDYENVGGLWNPGVNVTGDILLSTKGFEANSTYMIKLRMSKKGLERPFVAG